MVGKLLFILGRAYFQGDSAKLSTSKLKIQQLSSSHLAASPFNVNLTATVLFRFLATATKAFFSDDP